MFLWVVKQRGKSDDGVAMLAVISFIAVMAVITSLVATSVMSAQGFTSSTRASIQSQAAAEAGIAAARVGLINGSCVTEGGVYTGTNPTFEATVYVPDAAPNESEWVPGCPASIAMAVRIVSEGTASSLGSGAQSSGNSSSVEVLLSSDSVATDILATGPAIYAYDSSGFTGGGRLYSDDGNASVLIKTGNVNCNGGMSGEVDMIVDQGDIIVGNGCNITGSLWASGRVTVSGGPGIGNPAGATAALRAGNVIGQSLNYTGGGSIQGTVWVTEYFTSSGGIDVKGSVSAASVTMSSGGNIGGNVVTTGQTSITNIGTIGGDVSAGSLVQVGSTIRGGAWIQNNASFNWTYRINGKLTARTTTNENRGSAGGGIELRPTGTGASMLGSAGVAPTRPAVPGWVEFDYDVADWVGFTPKSISGTCTVAMINAAIAEAAGAPVVIDARTCTNGIVLNGSDKVVFSNDLAIISNAFDLYGGAGFVNSNEKRLWLINPDSTRDTPAAPTCSPGQSFRIDGGFTFSSQLDVMVYTPCRYVLTSSTTFFGQIYAGQAQIDGGSSLTYRAIGLPGVDLSTGNETAVSATEIDRVVLLQRNVDSQN